MGPPRASRARGVCWFPSRLQQCRIAGAARRLRLGAPGCAPVAGAPPTAQRAGRRECASASLHGPHRAGRWQSCSHMECISAAAVMCDAHVCQAGTSAGHAVGGGRGGRGSCLRARRARMHAGTAAALGFIPIMMRGWTVPGHCNPQQQRAAAVHAPRWASPTAVPPASLASGAGGMDGAPGRAGPVCLAQTPTLRCAAPQLDLWLLPAITTRRRSAPPPAGLAFAPTTCRDVRLVQQTDGRSRQRQGAWRAPVAGSVVRTAAPIPAAQPPTLSTAPACERKRAHRSLPL